MTNFKQITLISLATSSLLSAEVNTNYINMSHSWLTHSENGTVSDFKPTGFKWTIGKNLTTVEGIELAIEGTAMLGVKHDKKSSVASSSSGTFSNATIALDKLYNVNLRVQKEVINDLSLQAYLGASRGKMIPTALNNTPNHSHKNSLTYGAGLSYTLLPEISINLQYMQYFKNLDAVEFGLGFRF